MSWPILGVRPFLHAIVRGVVQHITMDCRFFIPLFALSSILLHGGCTTAIQRAALEHAQVSQNIQLGDTIENVLATLQPTQAGVPRQARKLPDRFERDGKRIFIFYARSGDQPDGLTTDDEFTPYVFENGKLAAIGWATLGGPKTQGQVVPRTTIYFHEPARY